MGEASERQAILLRLRVDLLRDAATSQEIALDVRARLGHLEDAAPEVVAYVAVQVHRYYTAVESLIERIERVLGAVPDGPDWHHELLRGATYELDGIRPPILSDATYDHLAEILRFRHFFRHAYVVALDARKLATVVRHVDGVHDSLQQELQAFAEFLRDLTTSLAD